MRLGKDAGRMKYEAMQGSSRSQWGWSGKNQAGKKEPVRLPA
jgi:hypothetical protein